MATAAPSPVRPARLYTLREFARQPKHYVRQSEHNCRMLALIYVFTIWCLATILYASVDRLETNRRLALVLKLLILAISAAATVRRLM